jgi:hypothetical protein
MIIIADCIRRIKNDNNDGCHIFSQSQLYDFLALAVKVMEREGIWTGQVNNIIPKAHERYYGKLRQNFCKSLIIKTANSETCFRRTYKNCRTKV